ncbi:MAG: YafY family protein [Tetrasphaera sp.]
MRADRLVAALLVLQARGRVTAAELADELEVSVATARRDLEALSMAGIPVYPQSGRGGGWQLVGGARTDLSGLNADEAQALFLLLGPTRGAHPQVRSALRKLLRALPESFRNQAEAAADAVVVDPAGWGDRSRPATAYLAALQKAVVGRHRVELTYAGRGGMPSTRRIDPWGLVVKNDAWYLVAGTDAGRRTFRLDRIGGAVLLDEPAERPADLDLEQVWAEVVGEVEERRGDLVAELQVRAGGVGMLRRTFGRHAEIGDPVDTEWVGARVAGANADVLARRLASFGGAVRVIAPPTVRARLAEIGAEILAVHTVEASDRADR